MGFNSAFKGLNLNVSHCWNRNIVVSTASRQGTGWSGVGIPVEARDFFPSPKHPDRLWTPLTIQFNGTGVRWVGRDIDHSPSSSAEVKNEWSYTSTSPICLHGMDRENFNFYLKFITVAVFVIT